MEIISSAEFGRLVGHYQDRALVEPVIVTRNGRERIVLLSAQEYHRLKELDRQALTVMQLPDSTRLAIVGAKMSSTHDPLNDLLPE